MHVTCNQPQQIMTRMSLQVRAVTFRKGAPLPRSFEMFSSTSGGLQPCIASRSVRRRLRTTTRLARRQCHASFPASNACTCIQEYSGLPPICTAQSRGCQNCFSNSTVDPAGMDTVKGYSGNSKIHAVGYGKQGIKRL